MSNSTWVKLADDRLVAFPGSAFLALPSEGFEHMGLSALSEDEILLLGLCGRMSKDGRSLAVSLPRPDKTLFVKLLSYLHRVRMDTLNGLILGSYFQVQTLWDRNDLVWLGRANQIADALDKVPGIQPCRITQKTVRLRGKLGGGNRIARTPLVSPSQYQAETLDLLLDKTHPFVFVIDATPSGIRDNVRDIWEGLSIYFPGVPILIFSALGDQQTDAILDRIPIHRWTHRLFDQYNWQHHSCNEKKLVLPSTQTLVVVPDTSLSALLVDTYTKIYNFRNQISTESKLIKQQSYGRAAKVQQILSTLSCPLTTRERLLGRHSRRGLFAIRTVERELEVLTETKLRFGDIESSRREIHDKLCSLYSLVNEGITGKTQALELLIREAVRENKSTLILVADKPEEDALIDFIHSLDISLVDDQFLSVKAAGHLQSALSLNRIFSRCIILARLWDKDLWWLAGVAKQIYWLCYPFEVDWCQKRLSLWERKYLRASLDDGDKAALLRLAWPRNAYLKDEETIGGDSTLERRVLKECAGSYLKGKTVSIDHEENPSGWLTEILAAEEHVEDEQKIPLSGTQNDYALITLQNSTTSIHWPFSKAVNVLSDSENGTGVEAKSVADLEPGEHIVLLQSREVHGEILNCLFEAFHSSSNSSELSRWASHWDTIVAGATEAQPTAQKLQAALVKLGTKVEIQTINNWQSKRVWGPEEQLSVKNMALVAGNIMLAKYAANIHQAIKRIWTEHRKIGKDLHRALLSRAEGASTVNIGSMTLDTYLLDEILQIDVVHSVELPGHEPLYPKSLADLAPRIQDEFSERLLLTRRALRSMDDSPYRELDKAWNCFLGMSCDLWRFYKGEIRRGELIESFQKIGVDVKSGTSQITQGMATGYEVKYDGETVDIGAHLCLGAARDPSKTLRIHYHWDSKNSLVVIHHAGRHLKTRLS